MIFLDSIIFKRDIEYDLSRNNQRRFKVNVEIADPGCRDAGRKYEYFVLFEKDLKINFNGITVIVGDNGTGKTSLLKQLSLPDFKKAFGDSDEIDKMMLNYIDDEKRTLKFFDMPKGVMLLDDLHKNSIRGRVKNEMDEKSWNGTLRATEIAHFMISGNDSNGEVLKDLYGQLHDIEDSIIIFDEPETSLSLNSISDLRAQLRILAKKNQIIISTHNPFIMRLCKEVYDIEMKAYVDTEKYLSKYGM